MMQQEELRLEKGHKGAVRNVTDWSRSGLRTTFSIKRKRDM
jgi:hypothetical protein